MRFVRNTPSILLAGIVLVLGCGGVLGARLAKAGADQAELPSRPTAEMRRARAAVPGPLRPVQALPSWLRRAGPGPLAVSYTQGIPDFGAIRDVQRKKVSFFSYLLPVIERENRRLVELRKRLGYVRDHLRWNHPLDADDRLWLTDVCQEFRLKELEPAADGFWETLLCRVDVLPVDLVLVQAANESAWGTSRFAREGNNFFGQWCFSRDCGMVPAARPDGATYEVARFSSVDESVGSYMRNLNAGYSYADLRRIRAEQRARGLEPDATTMAAGLLSYSERRQAYVDDIRAMLRHNSGAIEEARSRVSLASAGS
ncbi:MAG: hypothetical protein GY838_02365 [bacterium]|nr:hypothetical protein [bacterium]